MAATDEGALVHHVRARIAKSIVYVFLGVTVLLVLPFVIGVTGWEEIKEVLEGWSATYSLLVGAVVGYYFGPASGR